MADISGFGLRVNLVASNTFPNGVSVSQFADDADPFDIPALEIAQTAMGLNGDLLTWSVANPIAVTLNVVPNQEDDQNLDIVGEANRVGRGKASARDVISITGVYPDGRTVTLTGGKMVNYMPGNSVASSSRLKSKGYQFMFEGLTVTRTQS